MRRRLVLTAVGIAVIIVVAVIWIAVRALQARSALTDARTAIDRVHADLVAGRDADGDLAVARREAGAARSDTHDPVWAALSWVPPVQTVRGLAATADDLVVHAVTPVVHIAPSLRPTRLRVAHDRIALQPLRAAAPALTTADRAMAKARADVAALPGGWFGPITSARNRLLDAIDHLGGAVDSAARVARVGPAMLGLDGPRTFFIAVENNAESRGTGGLVGSFAILRADAGRLRVVRRGSDAEFHNTKTPLVDFGPAYDQVYGGYRPAATWKSGNLSPHFPYAADIWAHLWEHQTGQHVDGVIGIDPVALADVLRATGPARLPRYGLSVTADNVVSLALAQEYRLFDTIPARRRFLAAVSGVAIDRLLSGAGSAQALVQQLGDAASGGHLAVWSAHPAEQAELAGTSIAGELPQDARPFASVTVDNAAGGKLDYYLDRTLTYTATTCSGPRRPASIAVRLTNTAPAHGLPRYVLSRPDLPAGHELVANDKLLVFVHASDGALLSHVTLDGKATTVTAGTERGHPVFSIVVTIGPGQTRTLDLSLDERVLKGPPQTKVQPLARPQRTDLFAPTC